MAVLKQFEDELFALVSNIMYRLYKNQLQDKMRADRTKILRSDSVIVQADKSSNMYKMSVDKYNKKLKDNITRDYRKASRSDVDEVAKEARAIARTYDLDDRIDIPTEDEAFITIKDHKDSLPSRVECWLINPAKNSIGAISKSIRTGSTPPSGPPRSPTNGRTPARPLIGSLPSSLSQRRHSSNLT